jgi:hypothetical protein
MISTAQVVVTTTPQIIVADSLAAEEVHIHCSSGSLYIGGADVTVSNGLKIDNGDKLTFHNHLGAIYAVCSTGSPTISVLVIER